MDLAGSIGSVEVRSLNHLRPEAGSFHDPTPQTSNNIIQKGLAFGREQSGTVTVPGAVRPRDRAPPAAWPRRGCGGGGNDAAPTQWRIPMARLTDTQLVILSTASRRNDRGVDLPANVTAEAVRKAVDKLIRAGLLEEVQANPLRHLHPRLDRAWARAGLQLA